ncbi:MAG TPA: hypothetical protein VJM08_07490 [Anaerolineales bacterium]|nr:hypothetical protein [Anaerolineales bacterium]
MKSSRLLLSSFLFLSACTAAPIPQVPVANSGDILFQDEFENNTTGWDRVLNENGIMDYDQGGYRILVQQPTMNFWSTPEKNFRDVRVEADVIRLNGPDENRAGLICRYQNGDYYFFIISNDGFYAIGKFIGGNTILLGQTEMRSSEFILTNSTNHLRADCIGNTLTFFVNFNQIASAQDTDFPTGDVGLLAGSFSEPGVDVSFDHFVVMQP